MLRRLKKKVGGLDSQLAPIARRALASRLYPPEITRELGVFALRHALVRPSWVREDVAGA